MRARTLAFWFWLFLGLRVIAPFLLNPTNPKIGIAFNALIATFIFLLLLLPRLVRGMGLGHRSLPGTAKWMVVYLAWCGLSLSWTVSRPWFFAFGYWMVLAVDVATVIVLLRTADSTVLAAPSFKGFAVASWLVGLVTLLTPGSDYLRPGEEGVLHPNALGNHFAIAAIIAYFFAVSPGHERRVFWRLSAVAFTTLLLFTLSKGAILVFSLVLVPYVLLSPHIRLRTKLVSLTLSVMAGAILYPRLAEYMTIYAERTGSVETLTGRTAIWLEALEASLSRPLAGYGFYSSKIVLESIGGFAPGHAHNEWLQLWLTLGLVGVFCGIAIYASFWRTALKSTNSTVKSLCIVMVCYSLLHGMVEGGNEPSVPLAMLLLLSGWASQSPIGFVRVPSSNAVSKERDFGSSSPRRVADADQT